MRTRKCACTCEI